MSDSAARNGLASAVAKPREPTPHDNRRVLDALEGHYDIDRGLYHKSWSDKALAGHLDVPTSWVTSLRERFLGGPDRNEAAPLAAIEQLDKRLTKLVNDAAQIETDLKKLKDGLGV